MPSEMARTEIHLAPAYRQALTLFAVTLVHLFFCALTTAILLFTLPRIPPQEDTPPSWPDKNEHASERALRIWATALGTLAVVLAMIQYIPQLVLTARRKLVGSLSIPMMCLQVPGAFVFVYTLAVRPGVDWTGWATVSPILLVRGTDGELTHVKTVLCDWPLAIWPTGSLHLVEEASSKAWH